MSSRDISRRCSRSRSRSRRSPSPRGTRHYARNRSRSRSNSRRKPLGHSQSRNRRSRSRRRSNSSTSSSTSDVVEIEPPIRSDDPKYISCRLFIGRLPPEYTKADLTNYFKRYGPIIDVVVHSKGYGFVQFSNKENAKTAVENESGSIIKGHNVDVKMAADGRRPRGGGATAGGGPRRTAPESDRRPPAPRERSPIRDSYIDRFRDPYRDTVPPPRDDPYFADQYRRPPPVDDRFDRFNDPYRRRDPYDDPYARDPYYAPPPPTRRIPAPPPIECEIIMLHPQLRGYADKILDKLKDLNVVCGILSIPADQNIQKQLEDMSKHGVLYAIVINSQNEVHSSVILNILHGTPQEHRNMPLEDSVALVAKNFEAYLIEKAEKQTNRAVAAPPPAALKPFGYFLPPSSDVSYLLNLLADNRQLTVPEIDKIILYLRDRRVKMQEIEGRQHASDDLYHDSSVKPVQSPVEQEQQELKSKIMSILNGTNTVVSPPQSSVRSGSSLYGDYGRTTEKVLPSVSSHSSANPPMINFDSPSVQQALDNLIQTGPNLLKNIAPGVSQSIINNDGRLSTAPQSSPGYGARPAVQPSPYGGRTGNYPLKPESDVGYGGHQSGPAQLYGASAGHGASQPPGMRRY